VLAHNTSFEKAVWANILEPWYKFPPIELDQWRDTMASAALLNLPVSLAGLAAALGCKTQKDIEGTALMRRMAVAEGGEDGPWTYPLLNAENLARLTLYCERDVAAMLDAWFRMPPVPVTELRVWRLDQKVNARGVYLDRVYAEKLRRLAEVRAGELADETFRATLGELANSTSSPALKRWLGEQGVTLPAANRKRGEGEYAETETASKEAVKRLLEDPTLPPLVRSVLENRIEANKATSLAKLNRVGPMVGHDGRLRNALFYCGAHTGRWTSSGIQVHNLPKSKLSDEAADLARLLVDREDLEALKMVENRPLEVLSQSLRSVIAAPAGKELIAADYSAIEARVCAWLAGQDDVVAFFHQFDSEKRLGHKPMDFYVYTAQSIGSQSRSLGKVAALALQYGMGDLKFATTAASWGVPLELAEARAVKKAWREANTGIVDFWRQMEEAARAAILTRNKMFQVGKVGVYAREHCLFLVLPSGRAIRYWRPRLESVTRTAQVVDDTGAVVEKEYDTEEIQFFTVGPDKTRMVLESTYGGKLVENVTQAVARDLLAEALLRVEATAPYEIVMHVHDSVATEVPKDKGDVREFCALLTTPPAWAAGCPIAAEGYRSSRFLG
ncbi:MAG: hypothetical protein RLZZ246_1946, partial [Planctomycetota bacterium]